MNPHNTAINKKTFEVRVRNGLGKIGPDTLLPPPLQGALTPRSGNIFAEKPEKS
jgi:hypothetical protein